MSHDLDVYLPYDAGAGSSILEDQWRAMARFFSTSGPVRGQLSNFFITTTSGRNVIVSAGRCFINGQYGELSTNFTQAFTTNTSGNPRIDRVVLRNDFTANKIILDVLVGTPGASPSPPALTQNTAMWEISLAQVTLPSGYTAIIASQILDERSFAQGRPAGGPLVCAAAANLSAALTVPISTWTALVFDGADDFDTASMHVVGEQRFTVPITGLWEFTCRARWIDTAAATERSIRIVKNGTPLEETGPIPSNASDHTVNVINPYKDVFATGDVVTFEVWHTAGASITVIGARAVAEFLGPVS